MQRHLRQRKALVESSWEATTVQALTKRAVKRQRVAVEEVQASASGAIILDSEASLQAALDHLAKADPKLLPLIKDHGPPSVLLAKAGGAFCSLTRSILYQQLAGGAAAAIHSRFLTMCGAESAEALTPAMVLAAAQPDLRACGLSERKAQYVVDIARHFAQGLLTDEKLHACNEAQLLAELTKVRGVGPWTCHMHAMFHAGMSDVLPCGDLGVRKGMQVLYGLKALPSPEQMESMAEVWRPYRSVGSYYMWRVQTGKAAVAPKGGKKKAAAAAVADPTAS